MIRPLSELRSDELPQLVVLPAYAETFSPGSAAALTADRLPLTVYGSHRITNGFGTSLAVEIHTLFACRYSLIISCPLSRPMPLRL
jgi:hypothetical protein